MPGSRTTLLLVVLATFALNPVSARAGDDWQPISPDELKMTSEPKAPGAAAVYLYRQVDRDDSASTEFDYARIKILSEEGRKYADVEIAFNKQSEDIHGVQARTIRPDGSIANFDGKVFEKTIVKAKGVKFLAKTFTLPDVQVGSIIEYHYRTTLQEGMVFDSRWILSEELFTKHAKFSLKPYSQFALRWSWPVGLPQGTSLPKDDGHAVRLEAQDVPAFQIEDYMPPENTLKYRVEFIYSPESNPEKDFDKFWKGEGKKRYHAVDSFMDKRKAMEQVVAQTVAANDPPEAKLRKLYARAQQIRNLSFEKEKTAQESKRENLKDTSNVEDVIKRGYGNGDQIIWLFVALARAAGFQADPVAISTRDKYFFNSRLMNPYELNTYVALVKVDGKDLYLDPGVAYAPYGVLPWWETVVPGLRLDKDGGGWVTTSLPKGEESRVERKAVMQLTDTGSLEGKVTVTYVGIPALDRRLDERDADDTERKKFLEDGLKESIPAASEAELTNHPDWRASTNTLVAEFDVKVPGWAAQAGRRALLTVGLFGGGEKHLFEHGSRTHPIYFAYPFKDVDDLTIDLPLGWQISSVPQPQTIDAKACVYSMDAERKDNTLHLVRQLTVDLNFVDVQHYGALQGFFQRVRSGDEQQIVVSPMGAHAQN